MEYFGGILGVLWVIFDMVGVLLNTLHLQIFFFIIRSIRTIMRYFGSTLGYVGSTLEYILSTLVHSEST